MFNQSIPAQNIILRTLPADVLSALQPALSRLALKRRAILQEAHAPVDTVYFIERGLAAVLTRAQHDGHVEVGIVGRSGLIGVPALLGTARSPNRCVMEVEGEALQIGADDLRRAMDEQPALRRQLLGYVQALLVQNTQTALCNVRHPLPHRLARWLLLAADRLDSSVVPLTHELMSMMLGVRRAGITNALSELERAGAVKKSRGTVTIADRPRLEAISCECYRVIADEYAQLSLPRASAAPSCGAPAHHFGENEHAADSLSRVGA